MNLEAAQTVFQGFLKGGFDVFEALLSLSFSFDGNEPSEASDEDIGEALSQAPVIFKAKIKGGGAVAMLFSMADASRIVSLTMSGDAVEKDSFEDDDLGTLQEIADGVLGGGVANLSELFGEDVETEVIEIESTDGSGAEDLKGYLGGGIVRGVFTFSADPHFDGTGYFFHSAEVEARVPETVASGDEALVSDEEMQDILSGFTPEDEPEPMGNGGVLPQNLDVILGIELTATARLGSIEMPIGEILSLGPGAIIEVGQLVDEPVELLVNGKLIARGDVVVVDEKFGLRITEIISQKERIESLR